MKIALNNDYGGWALTKRIIRELGYNPGTEDCYFFEDRIKRNDPKLVELITKDIIHNEKSVYGIAEIPDNVTDWEISEYDGWESVIYVLDGKIHHRNADLFRDIDDDEGHRIIDGLNMLKKYKEETK